MDKGRWQKTLVQILTFRNTKALIPNDLLTMLVEQINPSFRALGLAGIGAEGIAIVIESGFKRKFLIKAALPEFAVTPVKETRIYDFTRKFRKIVEKNSMAERFREGCLVQMELAKEVACENLDYLYIPQVVQIHESPLFCQMEFVEGVTLTRWLRDRKDILLSLEYFQKLLRAFDFIHKRRVVYRDLKEEHILVTGAKAEKIAIIDWTLAKKKGDRNITKTGSGIGTFPFASPQAFWGGEASEYRYVDDLFGLGFLLWEYITLKNLPYLEPTEDLSVLQSYIDMLAKDLPNALSKIFCKLTAIQRNERYLTAESVIADILLVIDNLKNRQNTPEIMTGTCNCILCRNPDLIRPLEELIENREKILMICKLFGGKE